ncbi:MAG TPA: lipoprotein [Burkholderiaceae bacterium]|nr:lipoprotein [Burkholderiaceae bacterium]
MAKPSKGALALGANRRCATLIVALLLLTACGQKGPLYLPGHSKDTPWPVRTNPPATGAAAGQGAVAPAAAGAGTGAVVPAPDARSDEGGVSAKDGANAVGGDASSATPQKPDNAPQAPQ